MTDDEYHLEIRVVKANAGTIGKLFQKPALYVRGVTLPEGVKILNQFAQAKGVKIEL